MFKDFTITQKAEKDLNRQAALRIFADLYSCSIFQLGQQQQLEELANSILIEISKSAVPKWQEKLRIRYGWFKTDNCNHIIFDVSHYILHSTCHPVLLQGPYKQYMGRSRNTGQLSLVLYEDPPDGVPKIHVRSSKYMAWIAEMMLPTYLHVNKVFNTRSLYLN